MLQQIAQKYFFFYINLNFLCFYRLVFLFFLNYSCFVNIGLNIWNIKSTSMHRKLIDMTPLLFILKQILMMASEGHLNETWSCLYISQNNSKTPLVCIIRGWMIIAIVRIRNNIRNRLHQIHKQSWNLGYLTRPEQTASKRWQLVRDKARRPSTVIGGNFQTERVGAEWRKKLEKRKKREHQCQTVLHLHYNYIMAVA